MSAFLSLFCSSTHIYIYAGWPGHAPRGSPPQEVPHCVRGHPDLHHLRIEVEMKEWILIVQREHGHWQQVDNDLTLSPVSGPPRPATWRWRPPCSPCAPRTRCPRCEAGGASATSPGYTPHHTGCFFFFGFSQGAVNQLF